MAEMKGRWFRFSLRTLLLLVTALCVWLGIQVNAARRQREAVAAILSAGGTVVYDYEIVPSASPSTALLKTLPAGVRRTDKRIDHNQLPHGPAWLRAQIGDDYFRTVIAVYLNHPNAGIKKADLDQLAKLPHLREFVFEGNRTDIHDKDLATLGQLHELELLQFIGGSIDGSILNVLTNPARLKNVCFSDMDIDDVALGGLEKMTGLEILFLDRTRITDAGLAHLRNLINLENLDLGYTEITDAGLRQLNGLQKLTYVCLRYSKVSAAGVRALRAELPNANIVGP